MAEFALVVSGSLVETRNYPERPPNIPHKSVEWFPVVREEGEAFGGIIGDDFVIRTPPPAPVEPGTVPPTLIASAFNVSVQDSDIPSIDGIFNVAAAIYFDVGTYMLLLLSPQTDANYYVTIAGGAPCMSVSEKNADYFIIEARDAIGGAPVDPAQFSVQVYRT